MTTSDQRDHERRLFRRYVRDHDPATREELVRQYLPLARSIVRRFNRTGPLDEDLLQVASIGLLNAIDRYDPDLGHAFSSFAVPTILGNVRRHLRDHGWSIRPPRDLQERALAVRKIADRLSTRLGRQPTASELAEEMGESVETVVEALQALSARQSASLDKPLRTDDEETTLGMTIGADDDGYAQAEARAMLEDMLGDLAERDREILRLRFEEDLTQEEIGRRVGMSQMHVSRILRRLIGELGDRDREEPVGTLIPRRLTVT
jgi:RNA polymerase sigma-B factor